MKRILIILAINFLFNFSLSFSQGINIFDIDTTNYPIIKAKFYAYDKDGKIQRPTKDQLKIIENGTDRKIIDVSCPEPTPKKLSVCVMVDTYQYIELARDGTEKLIDLLDMQREDEVAITYMNKRASIWQDFTQNENKAKEKAKTIPNAPGVDINTMFYSQFTGGVPFIKDRNADKKVLILVSDLHCPNLYIDEARLIADAKKYNFAIYTLLLGTTDYSGLFTRFATATQGRVFENVMNSKDISSSFMEMTIQENNGPCEISWQGEINCNFIEVNFQMNWLEFIGKIKYKQPKKGIVSLQVTPKSFSFGKIAKPETKDTTLTITAINSDFTINDIKLKFGSSIFSLENAVFPILIPQNTSKNITIRCTPIDSNISYASFEIITNLCPFYFSTNVGYSGKKIKEQTLKLTHPNGGEVFVAGSDTLIKWDGISPNDTCKLEFSNDNGKNWKNITNKASDLKYEWTNVPKPASKQCLLKIKQIATTNESNSTINAIATLSGHTDRVEGLTYSSDGSRIATSSWDGTVKIWDANSEELLLTIPVAKFASCIAFSPDGSRILASSDDNTAKVWDAYSGSLLITLPDHKGHVNGVSFSPDGSKIATTSWGGGKDGIKLWDANTGILIRTISGHKEDNLCVSFSPDGSKILTGGSDNTAKIWETNTGDLILTFWGHINLDGYVQSAAYSPDGSKIISTNVNAQTAILWDANTGVEILSLHHKIKGGFKSISSILGVAYSPDGKTILAACWDSTAKIFDANTGDLIRIFSGHNFLVFNVSYSPDGNRIVTGSWDKTVKIWDIEPTPLQSDQSDSVFTILAPIPQFQRLDIDMGKVMVGASKDTMVTAVLCNVGEAPLHVLGVDVTNGNASEFMVPRGAGDFFLPPNECRDMMFAFMPSQVGKRNAKITVRSTIGDYIDTINITGEGIQPMVQVLNKFIDFGQVIKNQTKDSLQAQTIKNVGTADLKIKRIYQDGPNLNDFTEIVKLDSVILKPNEELKMDLRFTPKYNGRTSGTLMFEYDGIGSPAVVQLFGEGTSNNPNCDGRGFVFDNFNSTSKIKLFESAEITKDSTVRLTSTKSNQVGGISYDERLALRSSFEMYFSFRMSNGDNNQFIDGSLPGADGFAVLFQNGKNFRTTEKGGSLGFNGIENCVALEIDMYKNDIEFFDPNGNHVALQVPVKNVITSEHNATRTVAMNDQIFELRPDSTVYYGKLVYDADKKQIQFFLDSTNKYNNLVLTAENFDFSQYLNLELGDFAYLGITSTTGAATQIHELLSWEFCSERDEFLSVKDKYYESEEVKQIENILKLETGNIKEIEVIDITGKVLINKDINNNEINLNDLGISTGIYFIILKDDQNRSHFRKINVVK